MPTTPNMGLTTWGPNDYFNDLQLKANWEKVDNHNHDPESDGGVRINTNGIVDAAINNLKLANNSVTNAKIVDGTITKFKLANDLLIALEEAADAIKFGTVFGTGTTSEITGTYDDLQIKDASIVNTHIASGAQISPSKINIKTTSGQSLSDLNGVVDQAAQASGDVNGSFGALQIAPGVVGPSELAANAVSNINILNGAVTSSKIANGTILGEDIAAGAITPDKTSNANWAEYTPIWGSLNSRAPVVGAFSAVQGIYTQFHKTVFVRINVACGAGGFGVDQSYAWWVSLPPGYLAPSTILGHWTLRHADGTWRGGQAVASYFGGVVQFLDLGGSGGSASFTGFLDSYTYVGTQRAAFWPNGTQFSVQLTFPA